MSAYDEELKRAREEAGGNTRTILDVRRDLERQKEQYTVRSPALEKGQYNTWSREDAQDQARKASQVSPAHAASIHRFSDGKITDLYVNGRNTLQHQEERMDRASVNAIPALADQNPTRIWRGADVASVREQLGNRQLSTPAERDRSR